MLYLIKGTESLFIEEAITRLLQTENKENKKVWEITDSKTFEQALFELRMPDLFYQEPLYIFKMTEKTYKSLQKSFVQLPARTKIIQASAITLKQFPAWVEKIFREAGFVLQPQAKTLLINFLEGNILAAKQCLEQLKLIYPEEKILSEKMLLEILVPSGRYTLFDFLDMITSKQLSKISLCLGTILEDGIEPAIILWGLSRECRKQKKSGTLTALVEADETIKGMRPGNVFQALERAAFALTGKIFA